MEDGQVSSLGQTFRLDPPFFVLATQNPIEQEGTYPLPAAQLDRFMFEVRIDYPARDEEIAIMRLTTQPQESRLEPVLGRDDVLAIQAAVRCIDTDREIVRYATRLARLSRPQDEAAPAIVKKYVAYGAGPRAARCLVMGAKVLALMRGDAQPTHADVRSLVAPVFRHRVVLNFLGAADAFDVHRVLDGLVHAVPAPDLPARVTAPRRGIFAFFQKKA